ncbi:hypothetical protein [Paraburkholderia caribensis]|nr:hypothetical protein [Paraburkholderia caribensis]
MKKLSHSIQDAQRLCIGYFHFDKNDKGSRINLSIGHSDRSVEAQTSACG